MTEFPGANGGAVAVEVHPIPVIVFLSGSRRGTLLRLGGEHLHIGTDEANAIRVPMDTEPLPAPRHATLVRRGETYELVAEPGAEVWVNGEQVEHLVLASGVAGPAAMGLWTQLEDGGAHAAGAGRRMRGDVTVAVPRRLLLR